MNRPNGSEGVNGQAQPFDGRALRTALGAFVTGVTVITTQDEQGRAHGLTANSFNTVSLEPPLILWSQSKKAGSYPVFSRASEFAISILAEDQVEVSARFASRHEDKFAGVQTDQSFCGLPVIAGSSAWLHCRTRSQVDGGDHTIYIAEITRIARSGRRPLVFGGGQYLLAQPHHAVPPGGGSVPSGARQRHALRLCVPHMQRVAEDADVAVCASVWGNCGPTVVAWENTENSGLPSFPIGLVLPVTTSAGGKAFAAHLPVTTVAPFVQREFGDARERGAADATAQEQRWEALLADIRSARVAMHEPTPFWKHDMLISAGSVAVRGDDGAAIISLTAVVDSGRAPGVLEGACAKMLAAADRIEQQLGFQRGQP